MSQKLKSNQFTDMLLQLSSVSPFVFYICNNQFQLTLLKFSNSYFLYFLANEFKVNTS